MLGILLFPDKEFLLQENLNINSTVKCIYFLILGYLRMPQHFNQTNCEEIP